MAIKTRVELGETVINGDSRIDFLTFNGEEPDPGDVFGCMTITFLDHPAFATLDFALSDATDAGLRITGPDINTVLKALNTSTDTVPRLIWWAKEDPEIAGSIDETVTDPSLGSVTYVHSIPGEQTHLEIKTASDNPLIGPEDIIRGFIEHYASAA